MTIADVQNRLIANQSISDPVARAADYETLKADVAATFGASAVDATIKEAMRRFQLRV
jgi:hypothetical protein